VTALRLHHARQLEDLLLAGSRWQETGYVFTSSIGTPIHPGNLIKSFHALLNRAGLPRIRFHDLRHTYASLALAQNEHPKTVQENLRHSQILMTLDIYSHLMPSTKKEAAAQMDAALATNRQAIRFSARANEVGARELLKV